LLVFITSIGVKPLYVDILTYYELVLEVIHVHSVIYCQEKHRLSIHSGNFQYVQ